MSELGYLHEIIRKEAVVGRNVLPKVNRITALLKRWLLGTYQGRVEPSHLDYYLDEYTFRFNRRTSYSRGKLFYRLVEQAVAIEPVPGREIRGGVCCNAVNRTPIVQVESSAYAYYRFITCYCHK